MKDHSKTAYDRREVMGLMGFGAAGLAAGCGKRDASELCDTERLSAVDTEVTSDGTCEITSDDIEGPYYREDIPERVDIATVEEDGTDLVISGVVTDAACVAVAGARVEFWQANTKGDYDTRGDDADYYGWQATDGEGRYTLTTRMPGRYLNGATYRPAHIHVKVWVDGVERLTTQIYFDGDPYNETDAWFEESQSIALSSDCGGVFNISLA